MKKLLRYSRLGSAAVLASSPLLALAGCGSSDETPTPVVKVEPVVLTAEEKAWAERAAAKKIEVLSLKETQLDTYYKANPNGEKYLEGFFSKLVAVESESTFDPDKSFYLPIGFKIPSNIKLIGIYAFKKTALPEGFYLGPEIKSVGGGAFESLLEPLPSSFRFENQNVNFGTEAFKNTTLFDGFKVPINSHLGSAALPGDDSTFMYAKLPKGLFWYDRYGKRFLTDTTTTSGLKEKGENEYDWDAHCREYYNGLRSFKYFQPITGTFLGYNPKKIAYWQGATVRASIGPREGEVEPYPAE